jgi:hypothetical protein
MASWSTGFCSRAAKAATWTADVFDRAIADFAVACAGQYERDYDALAKAAASARVTAEHDL